LLFIQLNLIFVTVKAATVKHLVQWESLATTTVDASVEATLTGSAVTDVAKDSTIFPPAKV
jgi:hypothetical protein